MRSAYYAGQVPYDTTDKSYKGQTEQVLVGRPDSIFWHCKAITRTWLVSLKIFAGFETY